MHGDARQDRVAGEAAAPRRRRRAAAGRRGRPPTTGRGARRGGRRCRGWPARAGRRWRAGRLRRAPVRSRLGRYGVRGRRGAHPLPLAALPGRQVRGDRVERAALVTVTPRSPRASRPPSARAPTRCVRRRPGGPMTSRPRRRVCVRRVTATAPASDSPASPGRTGGRSGRRRCRPLAREHLLVGVEPDELRSCVGHSVMPNRACSPAAAAAPTSSSRRAASSWRARAASGRGWRRGRRRSPARRRSP